MQFLLPADVLVQTVSSPSIKSGSDSKRNTSHCHLTHYLGDFRTTAAWINVDDPWSVADSRAAPRDKRGEWHTLTRGTSLGTD